jgi:RHS repeat-associated protein
MVEAGLTQSRRAAKVGIESGPGVLRAFVPPCESVFHDNRGYVDYLQWSGAGPIEEEEEESEWQTVSYTYDPAGRHILAEYNGSGTLLRKYVHGPCVDEPICMIEASGTYAGTHYYHYDALGSVVAMTNSSGNVVQLYEYSVYGQVAASDANHPNRFMFTGREFDKDTGLYYYRARYYNPEIGRFLQTDPIGYGDGMNVYRYCMNNPLGFIDPSGCATKVRVFFYDPCEVFASGEHAGECMFTEAANDFEISLPMRSTDDVLAGLKGVADLINTLNGWGFDLVLDGVYFGDHCHANMTSGVDGSATVTDVSALEFGGTVVSTKEGGENWGFWKQLGEAVPTGVTINFRHCLVGWDAYAQMTGEKKTSLLANLASWTGDTVTGAITEVEWKPTDTANGPDYEAGTYYKATPAADGTVTIGSIPLYDPNGNRPY